MRLIVGFVPEHFSTPLFLAERQGFFLKNGLEVSFKAFPSGSGHLIQSLQEGSINMAVGLTEAFVKAAASDDVCYKLIGTYVKSPLRWAVSTGGKRQDINSVNELEGKVCGVSRIGSGSDIMSKVLKEEKHWTKDFQYEVLDSFGNLRQAVNNKMADFFMWEHFTSKRYFDNGEIKSVGDIYTPWPSWVIVADGVVLKYETVALAFCKSVNEGIEYFKNNTEEAIRYIVSHFDYEEATVRAWLDTVEFSDDASRIDPEIVSKTLAILKQAITLPENCDQTCYIQDLHSPIINYDHQK